MDKEKINDINFDLPKNKSNVIKVIGVGGGGSNAINYMFKQGIIGVDFVVTNTDAQALSESPVPIKIQLGASLTEGLGAGANPEIGAKSAEESYDDLQNLLMTQTKMVFITAGMGGGTGTGAAPIVAQVSKELGILTVAVVTKPFELEGKKRMEIAKEGVKELVEEVDSLITIPNQKLLEVLGQDCSMIEAFSQANDVLSGAVRGISDIIMCPGLINVDFADVRTVMSEKGTAMMGTGSSTGPDRARIAAEQAVSSKLLEDISLKDAKGVLVNITAGPDITLGEIQAVGDCIESFAANDAIIVTGNVINEALGNELVVTVIATGLGVSTKNLSSLNERKFNDLNVTQPLPLSDAARNLMENPPKIESVSTKPQEDKDEDDGEFLNIPSFVRTQLD